MDYISDAVLFGEKIILRTVKEQDAEPLFQLIFHDRDVLEYYVAEYQETFDRSNYRWIENSRLKGRYWMAIVEKETGKTVGMIHQCNDPFPHFNNVEIGYALGKEYIWQLPYVLRCQTED